MQTTTKIILAAALAASGFGIIQMAGAMPAGAARVPSGQADLRGSPAHMAREVPTSELSDTTQR